MSAAPAQTETIPSAQAGSSAAFFRALPAITGFNDLADPSAYAELPPDWIIGVADVVKSTDAIRAGRYKAVNTAGAAVISAVSNALGSLDFPYIFTGDGMCYAVNPDEAPAARRALAASIAWVGRELGLELRGGEISVGEIRATGRDVRVARFAASADASYAMFAGGGVVWAEDALKAGSLRTVSPDPALRPDLTGLSCRFRPVPARHGLILSLIVSPAGERDDPRFRQLVADLLGLVDASADASLPVRVDSLPLPWPPRGFRYEAGLQRRQGEALGLSMLRTGAWTLLSSLIMWTGRDLGSFSPERYRRQLVANSDHRKFEDRLMMTVDCSPRVADAITAMLDAARRNGTAEFGLHRQATALITCVVPSPSRPNHVHFIDGAAGGYALAALDLKQAAGRNTPPGHHASGTAA